LSGVGLLGGIIVEPGQVAQMEAVAHSRRSTPTTTTTAVMKIKQPTMRGNNNNSSGTKNRK